MGGYINSTESAWLSTGKDLLQSRAFWGFVVMLIGLFGDKLGISIGDKEEFIAAAIGLGGAILAFIGTIRRKGPITSIAGIPVKPPRLGS